MQITSWTLCTGRYSLSVDSEQIPMCQLRFCISSTMYVPYRFVDYICHRTCQAIDDFTAAMDHMAEKYAKLYGDMEKATTKSQREYLESLVTTQMQQQSKCEQLLTQAHESYLQSEGRPYTKGAGQRNLSVSDGTFAVVPTDVCHWSEFFESFGDEESGLDIGDYTLFGEGECVDGGALQEASEFTRISIALDDDSDSETEEIVEDFVVVNSPKPTNGENAELLFDCNIAFYVIYCTMIRC